MYRIAVTNRHLCEGDFLERIRQIAQGDEYNAILLREKDLSHEEYEELAKKVLKITNLATDSPKEEPVNEELASNH